MSAPRRRALLFEHGALTPAGRLGEWLDLRGFDVTVRGPAEGYADDPGDFAIVASLGSEHGVGAGLEWIDREIAFLRECVRRDVPILGLCFGGQTLASALGARVRRSDRGEIGWVRLNGGAEGIAPGPWFNFHFDQFDTPLGAVELGRSELCPHAFRIGPHLGVQFHPEVTPNIVERWLTTFPEKPAALGIDVDHLVALTWRESAVARLRAFDLFDRFWEGRRGERWPASQVPLACPDLEI